METQEREDPHEEFVWEIGAAEDIAGRSAATVLSMSKLLEEAAKSRYPELHGLSLMLERLAQEISLAEEAAAHACYWHEECLKRPRFRLIKGGAS